LADSGVGYRLSSLSLVQAVAWLSEWSSILSGEEGDVLCGKAVTAMWVFPQVILTGISQNKFISLQG